MKKHEMIDAKIIRAAHEFGLIAVKLDLSPEELLSALHLGISIALSAKYKVETFQDIQLL